MSKWFCGWVITIVLTLTCNISLYAQLEQLHGEKSAVTTGVADGSIHRLAFDNDDPMVVSDTATDLARHVHGPATGAIHTMIVDSNNIKTGHTYRITFIDTILQDGNKRTRDFSLANITQSSMVLFAQPLVDTNSLQPLSYVAEGFHLSFDNPSTFCVDKSKSNWNADSLYDYNLLLFHYSTVRGYPEAADYRIEFGELGIDTTIMYKAKAKTFKSMPVNFRVKNLTTDKYIPIAFWQQDGSDGYFTAFSEGSLSDRIVFLDDALSVTWMFELVSDGIDSSRRNPRPGDVVNIYLDIPFTSDDIFEMTMPQDFDDVEDGRNELPLTFALMQNYPNPFNPETTIGFTLPQRAGVKLEIFNVLGQRVKSFTNPAGEPGEQHFIWDGKSDAGLPVSGGIYIYRITAQTKSKSFVSVKKMVLLK